MKKLYIYFSLFIFHLSLIHAQSYIITTFAGNGVGSFSGDEEPAISAELWAPVGATVDGTGNVYIADANNNRIRKVNTEGVIATVAGNSSAVYWGDGGPATAAGLNQPLNVAVDVLGNVYVVDANNNRIRKINTGGVISTIAGTGDGGYNGDAIPATSAELWSPVGVVVDSAYNVYIADGNNQRIRLINAAGIISTIAGNGYGGYSGDGGAAISAELYDPDGIAIDGFGNVYIADQKHRIRKVSRGGIISTVAGNGIGSYSGDGGPATSAELYCPWGVTLDHAGNLYIADEKNQRIRMVNTAGIISTIAGMDSAGYSGDGGTAISAKLNWPIGVAMDNTGNVYIADYSNNRIRKLTIATGINELTNNPNSVTIFPNPSDGTFKLQMKNEESSGWQTKNEVEVYNVFDEKVYSSFFPFHSSFSINLSFLTNGTYFYRVYHVKSTMVGNGKIIIDK